MKVVFVCTGNTCRSPMAEFLFKKMLKDANRTDVNVASAGVSPAPWLGLPQEAQDALAEEGVTGVQHRAKELSEAVMASADLIIAMEEHHKEAVLKRFPSTKGKIQVLGIEDPFQQPAAVYKRVLSEIKVDLKNILKKI